MKREDLIVGHLYGDKDRIECGIYKGGYGAGTLSEFARVEFDENGVVATDDNIILTEMELKHWVEY